MEKKESKKEYVKPVIRKHKAAAVVSGSGGGDSDCVYSSRMFLTTYYH